MKLFIAIIVPLSFFGCRPATSDIFIETVDTAYIRKLPVSAESTYPLPNTADATALGAVQTIAYQFGGGQKTLILSYDAQDRVIMMVEKKYKQTIDSIAFYPNGQRMFQLQFNNQGLAEGSARFFYSDGRVSSDGPYTGGIKTGIWRQFNPNGRLRETHEFDRYGKQQR